MDRHTTASQIAAELGLTLVGPDVEITRAASLTSAGPHTVVFAKAYSAELAAALNRAGPLLVIAAPGFSGQLAVSHVLAEQPRLAFARTLQTFFASRDAPGIALTAQVHPSARLGANVSIGPYTLVDQDAEVGDDTILRSHVVLAAGCRVGKGCLIKSHTVIGQEGFGFDFEDDGTPVRVSHLGRVRIGDDVEIGALNTVARGTLDETVVGDHVKTDDQVHIAHNVIVGENTVITACAEISGSVHIGRNVWIGPNASILNGVTIGDGAMVGIGAVVTKPVAPGASVAGNPARALPAQPESSGVRWTSSA